MIIEQELEKLTKILQKELQRFYLILKIQNFLTKLQRFTKIRKKFVLALVFLVIKMGEIFNLYIEKYL